MGGASEDCALIQDTSSLSGIGWQADLIMGSGLTAGAFGAAAGFFAIFFFADVPRVRKDIMIVSRIDELVRSSERADRHPENSGNRALL